MNASEANEKSTKSLYEYVLPDELKRVLSHIDHITTMGEFYLKNVKLRYETIQKLKELGYNITGCPEYGYTISWKILRKKPTKKWFVFKNRI